MVVRRGRAARPQQRRQTRACRRALDPRIDPRPRRIELDQPLEERRLLREPARGPLVEVVVAVDQPGRREAAARVDPRAFERRFPGPTAVIRLPSTTMCPSRETGAARPSRSRSLQWSHDARLAPTGPRPGSSRSPCSGTGSRQCLADLRVRWRRVTREQVVRGDDQPRRAEPALDRARLEERLLDRMQLVFFPNPSTVTTERPSAWPAATRHEHTSAPSR